MTGKTSSTSASWSRGPTYNNLFAFAQFHLQGWTVKIFHRGNFLAWEIFSLDARIGFAILHGWEIGRNERRKQSEYQLSTKESVGGKRTFCKFSSSVICETCENVDVKIWKKIQKSSIKKKWILMDFQLLLRRLQIFTKVLWEF